MSGGWRDRGDRRYLDFHYSLPRDWWSIDLDNVEACASCRRPLLLVEVTRNPEKATTILEALAEMASLPAVLVLLPDELDWPELKSETPIRWRWIYDGAPFHRWQSDTLEGWFRWVAAIREAHQEEVHHRRVAYFS